MNDRFCHRCDAELASHSEGDLVYCAHCGAPQLWLSEELQQRAEAQAAVAADGAARAVAGMGEARDRMWRDALNCISLVAGVAAGLAVISLDVGPVLFLAWLWALSSPMVVLALLKARSPQVMLNARLGARIGLVTGLAVALALGVVNTLGLFVARRMHALGGFDKQMDVAMAQVRASMDAQYGAQAAAVTKFLLLPEFRAWVLLGSCALGVVMLVVACTVFGAVAGFMRERRA